MYKTITKKVLLQLVAIYDIPQNPEVYSFHYIWVFFNNCIKVLLCKMISSDVTIILRWLYFNSSIMQFTEKAFLFLLH